MTRDTIHNIGVAGQIGQYSDAVETIGNGRLLFISGTPGLAPDGTLPSTFEDQAEQAWKKIIAILERAGMRPEHLVKVTQYLTRAEDIPAYRPIRSKYLTDNRPGFMLAVIPRTCAPEVPH